MTKIKIIVAIVMTVMSLSGCYHTKGHDKGNAAADTSFYAKHHYAENYNFVVKADSMSILMQQPEELINNMHTDSIMLHKDNRIVVAEIRMLPSDPIDSVWVQVARDQCTFGWTHESYLLANVVPDDPISMFISTFSDTHLLIFLIVISIIGAGYMLYKLTKRNVKLVHFNDIDSFYPALLAVIVAAAATFYSSLQLFAPDTWRHFYYNPTLNPFNVPMILSIFLSSVWLMVIMAIATADDVYHKLPAGEATMYLCGLAAVCATNYIIFSIATLYYIGFPLLATYIAFAIRQYLRR